MSESEDIIGEKIEREIAELDSPGGGEEKAQGEIEEETGEETEEILEEETGEETENEPEEKSEREDDKPKRKKFSSKKKKILIVVVIIAIALIIVLWGAAPGDYVSLKTVVENRGHYLGEEVEVKGKVGNWSGGQNFTMVDDNDITIAIEVVHDGAIPEGFATGKVIVVKGKLEEQDGNLTLSSTKIQVGCPSKY